MAADGGARSPLTYVFFLPMVFAAVFYPLRLFVPVGAIDMIAFVLVGDLYGDPDPTQVAFIAALPRDVGDPLRLAGAEPRPPSRAPDAACRAPTRSPAASTGAGSRSA